MEVNQTQQPTPVYQAQPQKKSPWKRILITLGGCGFLIVLCSICIYLLTLSAGITELRTPTTKYTTEILEGKEKEKVAVIDIKGTIMDFAQPPSLFDMGITSAEEINKMIEFAINDENVKAILFRLNTPGGSLTAVETICAKIKEAQEKDIYTAAWIHTEGASGGYYVASCTNWIIARKDSITGSIGVAVEAIDAYSFLEKIGFRVKVITNTQGTKKAGQDLFTEGSETERIYKSILDEGYEQFIDRVEEGRKGKEKNLTRSEIIKLSDGRIYSGAQAYKNGLVDQLGDEKTAVKTIKEKAKLPESATVELIKRQSSFWDMLAMQSLTKLFRIEITDNISGIRLVAIAN